MMTKKLFFGSNAFSAAEVRQNKAGSISAEIREPLGRRQSSVLFNR
uniref:Uncharacterized protein n=1 Tax=Anguilla anguilla TaxID=7936 RepID=A0A0E9RPR2_ANGAN